MELRCAPRSNLDRWRVEGVQDSLLRWGGCTMRLASIILLLSFYCPSTVLVLSFCPSMHHALLSLSDHRGLPSCCSIDAHSLTHSPTRPLAPSPLDVWAVNQQYLESVCTGMVSAAVLVGDEWIPVHDLAGFSIWLTHREYGTAPRS